MKIFCILGDERVVHSKSPKMHTAVLQSVGIHGAYVPFAVERARLAEAVKGLAALGVAGANVTVPHKEAVIPYLDGLSETAYTIGAVNTIMFEDGRLIGWNTDSPGFLDALHETGFRPEGSSALVLGTGGAARAILFALRDSGAKSMILAGRDEERTRSLAKEFNALPMEIQCLAGSVVEANLLVNATAVSSPSESRDTARIAAHMQIEGLGLVADLNYGRQENIWERLASRAGVPFLDGLSMLAHQARRSFRLWTRMDVAVERFRESLEDSP